MLDVKLSGSLQGDAVVKVCRYVDDFLFLIRGDVADFESFGLGLVDTVRSCFSPLQVTYEFPDKGVIRFLDLSLKLCEQRTCWVYKPRAGKPLLPFDSAHSKLVKRGIASLCMKNALQKSCSHHMFGGFGEQIERLIGAGYPKILLTAVAESLLASIGKLHRPPPEPEVDRQRTAVIPYLHNFSHHVKRVGVRANVRVVFSAPLKLSSLSARCNPCRHPTVECRVSHRTVFVPCVTGVVYRLPLSCGKVYIGQSGRCLNDRLREHRRNVEGGKEGWLALHCRDCACRPIFTDCVVLGKSKDRLTREIMEAYVIADKGTDCVSTPSIALTDRERSFLAASGRWMTGGEGCRR